MGLEQRTTPHWQVGNKNEKAQKKNWNSNSDDSMTNGKNTNDSGSNSKKERSNHTNTNKTNTWNKKSKSAGPLAGPRGCGGLV